MLIGSNNTLTYLEPSSWWFKVFRWLGRHQEIPYDVQYTFYGVRMYDLRLYFDENRRIVARNGSYIYPLKRFYEMLDFFDKQGDVTVLITLNTTLVDENIDKKFANVCNILNSIYKNIWLCGGYRKFDKEVLYEFDWERKNKLPKLICPAEWSVSYRFVRKWCPFLIKRFNKMYIERYKDIQGFLMLDYVNRR